jgi:hypothetical protein
VALVDKTGRIEMICVYPEDRTVRKRLIKTLISKIDPKSFVHNLELDSDYQESMNIYSELGFRPREISLTVPSPKVEKSKSPKGTKKSKSRSDIVKKSTSQTMNKTQGLVNWPKDGEEPGENWSIGALRRYAEKHGISLKGVTKKVNVLKLIKGEAELEPETVRKKPEAAPTTFKVGDYVVALTDSMAHKEWYFGRVTKITPTGQVRISTFYPQKEVVGTERNQRETSESYRVTNVDSKSSSGAFIRVSAEGKWKEYPHTFWRTISKKDLLERVFEDSFDLLH